MPFIGTVPTTRCSRLSGADCDELVTPDDEYCARGHELLPREYQAPASGSLAANRPRLGGFGREPTDFETLESGAEVLGRIRRAPGALYCARKAANEFASHHGVEEHEARAELFLLVEKSAAEGNLRRTQAGWFRLTWESFAVVLDPSGSAVTGYSTRHYERTPSEVIAGVPSRFKKKGGPYRPDGPVLAPGELVARADKLGISESAARAWSKYGDPGCADAVESLRPHFAALGDASWELRDRSVYHVIAGSRGFFVAADKPYVIAVFATETES